MIKALSELAKEWLPVRYLNYLRRFKWWLLRLRIDPEALVREALVSSPDLICLKSIVRSGDIVLDIGANVGQFAFHLGAWAGPAGKVYAFEPRRDTFDQLVKVLSGIETCVPVRMAASNQNTKKELVRHLSPANSSLVPLPRYEGFAKEQVETITIDHFCASNGITSVQIVKIDTEGHEFEVLEGMNSVLSGLHPLIICELEERHLSYQGRSVREFIQMMQSRGYDAFAVIGRELRPVSDVRIPTEEDAETVDAEYLNNFWFVRPGSEMWQRVTPLMVTPQEPA